MRKNACPLKIEHCPWNKKNDSLRLALKIIVQEKRTVRKLDATNRKFPTITPIPAIDLSPLRMRCKVVSSMLAQRQTAKLIKTEETGYQARDVPRLLEAALIEQRERQSMSLMIQHINRQREGKCL